MCNIMLCMLSETESELLVCYSHNSVTRIIIAIVRLAVGHRLLFHSVINSHSSCCIEEAGIVLVIKFFTPIYFGPTYFTFKRKTVKTFIYSYNIHIRCYEMIN